MGRALTCSPHNTFLINNECDPGNSDHTQDALTDPIRLEHLFLYITENRVLNKGNKQLNSGYINNHTHTVNFSFSTNAFCFATGSGLMPTIWTLSGPKVSFSVRPHHQHSLNTPMSNIMAGVDAIRTRTYRQQHREIGMLASCTHMSLTITQITFNERQPVIIYNHLPDAG